MLARRDRSDGVRGFTLIELLIVIAIIAILAAVTFVALNPLKRFQDSRDSVRWTDTSNILDAIKVDQIDNGGSYLYAIDQTSTSTEYMISVATTTSGCDDLTCDVNIASDGDCVNLQGLVDEGYLGEMPVSPRGEGSWTSGYTGYYLIKNDNDSITIGACESENSNGINVTR